MKVTCHQPWAPPQHPCHGCPPPPPPPPSCHHCHDHFTPCPSQPSVISRIGGGLWGAGIGANVGGAMLMAFRPELGAADPATSAAMVAGAVIGASCGAQAGFAKSALTTLGGAVAGHFAMAATGDPLVTLAAAAGGALVGYALAS